MPEIRNEGVKTYYDVTGRDVPSCCCTARAAIDPEVPPVPDNIVRMGFPALGRT